MACDGVGPSFTCLQIVSGMTDGGFPAEVFAVRKRGAFPGVRLKLSMPGPLGLLPYRWIADHGHALIERRYLSSIREGDVAYLWPSASLAMHRILHDRGFSIVLEGINTRMASARLILDQAYDAFGIAPAHGITDARIAEEEEKYHFASAIFAPSRAVEKALQGSPLEQAVLSSSYGVLNVDRSSTPRDYAAAGRPVTVMFCGYACVRKGVHHLLEAWKDVPAPHRLRIVGRIEPAIAERYGDILNSDRVDCIGFVKDVHPWFASADVFVMPSLEEGDPLVTYEAASHGLPILASEMGAGRMGDTPGALKLIDPANRDSFVEALTELVTSPELRAELGKGVHALVRNFTWSQVGKRRGALLQTWFGQSTD